MKELKNKRIFISGGAGVIGREMVKILSEVGAKVLVGDLQEIPNGFPKNVIYRRGDLNYITQQELDNFNPEIFIHLAATFERSTETYEHWEENFWHNIRLSNYLMTLMRNVPALKRVVYPSSYLIYSKELYNFDKAQDMPVKLKETDPISPRNLTGMAKLAHEVELEFLDQFKSDKFTSVCARIFRGYGKNSRDVISRWVRDLLNGNKIYIYKPEGWFDYLYAEDSAKGLLKLALSDGKGIINLGTGRARRVQDVVDVLRQHFPNMESEIVESNIKFESSEAETTKLLATTGWVPERDLENTIPEIIEYERNKEQRENEKSLHNVLVTSISKKVSLIKTVKRSVQKINGNIKVFGGDLDKDCLGSFFVDEFWEMPRMSDLSPDILIKYCKDNNIGLIIPSRDGELEYFAKHAKKLKDAGIYPMVSDLESIENCLDKLKFAQLQSLTEYVIPAYSTIDECKASRFVVKERFGAGALSIGINLDHDEANEHMTTLETPIIQPFIEGYEITVDAYIDRSTAIKGLIMRTRDKVVNGESQITTTFENDKIESDIKKLIEALKLYGHVTLQAIIEEDDKVNLIECNPRFGGASTLSVRAGLDTFYWLYLESLGCDIDLYSFIRSEKPIRQVRYPADCYL